MEIVSKQEFETVTKKLNQKIEDLENRDKIQKLYTSTQVSKIWNMDPKTTRRILKKLKPVMLTGIPRYQHEDLKALMERNT